MVGETTPAKDVELKKPQVKAGGEVKPAVAPTIKEFEADEPLLQENPHRFVLFPIKYHEVRTRP
jgi:ribonucleoside-diphosphate reductase subunit M2